jgi:hypothetical protein
MVFFTGIKKRKLVKKSTAVEQRILLAFFTGIMKEKNGKEGHSCRTEFSMIMLLKI